MDFHKVKNNGLKKIDELVGQLNFHLDAYTHDPIDEVRDSSIAKAEKLVGITQDILELEHELEDISKVIEGEKS